MQDPHPDPEIRQAIVRLNDALCTWERNTGLGSILIIREQGGWSHRSLNGKPDVPNEVSDQDLAEIVAS